MPPVKTAHEMPREKLISKGAESLSDTELLQAVIGSGGAGNDFKMIAKNLNAVINKVGAENLTFEDVKGIKGIGDAKAAIVFAALEFWKRRFTKQTRPIIDEIGKAAAQLEFIRGKHQEHFVLLTLDGARRLINTRVISMGTLNAAPVHPREVFAPAVEDRANSIIIAHNHPSGTLTVGSEDIRTTERIKEAGELLGIALDDHVIITRDGFVSAMH